jgi:hypothetical protein
MKPVQFVLALVLVFPAAVAADTFATLGEARKVTDQAVGLFQREEIVAAYATLKPYWPLPQVEVDNLANQTHTQWPMLKQRFGASVATEFVQELRGGASLARFVYLQKFQHHAIRWVFTFYRPQDRWVINGVSFDDRLDLLLESR